MCNRKKLLTGVMPALEKYIETYKQMNELMKAYKELIEEDVKRLSDV